MGPSFVKIPSVTIYYRHDFINGGHKWPVCGTTETRVLTVQRRIHTWNHPTIANDITQTELNALYNHEITNQIEEMVIRDINNNHRFYHQNNLNEVLNRWNRLTEPIFRPDDFCQPLLSLDLIGSEYTILPNEEGWFTKGAFESILIKMDMKPYRFLKRLRVH